MRSIFLAFLLMPATIQAGELPPDPILQILMWGESAPIDVDGVYPDAVGEGTLAGQASLWNAPVRNQGRGDFSYACATDGQWVTWALSDRSDQDGEPMLTAIVEAKASPENADCTKVAELDLNSSKEDRPGIAMTPDELDALIDLENMNANGLIGMRSVDTLGDGGGSWTLIRTVTYHIAEDGSIDAVAYEAATVR